MSPSNSAHQDGRPVALPDRQSPVFLFDSDCVLCSRAVRFTLRHEREPNIRFVAVGSAEGRSLAMRFGVDPEDPKTFLFVENGRGLPKSDGVIALARHLSGPARLLSLIGLVPRAARDRIYDLFARHRYALFGRTTVCIHPSPRLRDRFVLPEVEG